MHESNWMYGSIFFVRCVLTAQASQPDASRCRDGVFAAKMFLKKIAEDEFRSSAGEA